MTLRPCAILALLLACSERKEPPPPPPPPPEVTADLTGFCAARAAAVCEALVRCWPNSLGKPDAVCREEQATGCLGAEALEAPRVSGAARLAALSHALKAKRAVFDEAAAKACVEGLATRCGPEFPTAACALETFVTPAVGLSGICRADYECQNAVCAYHHPTDCSGTCAPYAAPDDICENDRACGPNGYCATPDLLCTAYTEDAASCGAAACRPGATCAGGTCVRSLPVGAECDTDTPPCADPGRCLRNQCRVLGEDSDECQIFRDRLSCAPELYCDHGLALADPGRCHPRHGPGETCYYGWDCLPGLACLGADFQTPQPGHCGTPVEHGRSCTPDVSWTPSVCARGSYCSVDQVCAPWPGLGGACDPRESRCPAGSGCQGSPPTCQAGEGPGPGDDCSIKAGRVVVCRSDAYCVYRPPPDSDKGTCAPRKAEGAPCTTDSSCLSLRCVSGICAAACTPG